MRSQAQETASGDGDLAPAAAQTAKPKVSLTQTSAGTRALHPNPPTHGSFGCKFGHGPLLSSPPAEQKGHFCAVCGSLKDQLS